jgi:hypothetical protein
MALLQVNYLIGDGKSHWLEGVLLMMMYLIIALAAWYVLEEICLALDSKFIANLVYQVLLIWLWESSEQ